MTAARAEAVVVAEPAPYSAQRPTFAWTDAVLPFYLAGMAVVAATVPSRHWRRICRALAIAGGTLSGRHSRRTANIASVLRGYHDDADAADIAWEQGIAHNEARLHCLQFYCGRRWHPDIRIDGLDHVEEALAQGRGAILWTQPMAYSDIVTKMAFHQAGHAISHLSRPAHGLTRRRLFAPLWTSVERRFLAERLIIESGRVGPVMATITQRLAENKLVSITVGAQARQTCRVPFFNGHVELALGPVKLACRTGARLLPVFTVRTGENESVTTVEPALEVAPSVNGEPDDIRVPLSAYAELLESYVGRWPRLYLSW